MGVQYHGVTNASAGTRYSTTKSHSRQPDLTLEPTKEGIDFTLRLLQANRMAKVVELTCDFSTDSKRSNKHPPLEEEDIMELFRALGSTTLEDDDNEEDKEEKEEEQEVMEEYQPPHMRASNIIGGLPYLEALTIHCENATENTPRFISGLTAFLASSQQFPRFTRLALQGVNLRGTALELRALAETFRMHPNIRHIDMKGCWFTDEQQKDMSLLQQAFKEQQQRSSYTSSFAAASQASRTQQLAFGPSGAGNHNNHDKWEAIPASTAAQKTNATNNNNGATEIETNGVDISDPSLNGNATHHNSQQSWFERMFKSCFCW